ncbi:MAG: 8-amino-7-oxononanoate synthase [Kiritimatiellae bacterium]|nr:8-amino-7-oxononanoate synthase [Kiritimatiellia bacterium]MCO5068286.1 8-amino-7-oxononanoate synthase [Kiritimatiellia bacterium]
MNEWIEQQLSEVAARGESRQLTAWPTLGPYLQRADQRILNLAGNDYLGLTAHPAVREAAARAARDIGTGATASRLLAGTATLHEQLETELADWKGHPSALLFSSGYLAALGIIPLLAGRDDLIVADRLCHASLLDAARLSGATLLRFHHNDIADAHKRLAKRPHHPRCLIVTESLFSMDGDTAPLPELLALAQSHNATLLVDEAHALGVAGPRGAGLTADQPEAEENLVTLGTLGKSLAAAGGFITGPAKLRTLMINRARTFIFDTALPPPTLAAARAALTEIRAHPEWPYALAEKAARLRAQLSSATLDTTPSQSHIIPVRIGDNHRATAIASRLSEQNTLVAAIRPPTVPPGTARLRLSLSLAHSDTDLQAAAAAIQHAAQNTP